MSPRAVPAPVFRPAELPRLSSFSTRHRAEVLLPNSSMTDIDSSVESLSTRMISILSINFNFPIYARHRASRCPPFFEQTIKLEMGWSDIFDFLLRSFPIRLSHGKSDGNSFPVQASFAGHGPGNITT